MYVSHLYYISIILNLKGDPGMSKPPGRMGETGAKGYPGMPGDAGLPGLPGLRGPAGLKGIKGDCGDKVNDSVLFNFLCLKKTYINMQSLTHLKGQPGEIVFSNNGMRGQR